LIKQSPNPSVLLNAPASDRLGLFLAPKGNIGIDGRPHLNFATIHNTSMRISSRSRFWLIALVPLTLFTLAWRPFSTGKERGEVLQQMVYSLLNTNHIEPKKVDDSFSEIVFKEYLEDLDGNKRFFTQSDLKVLGKYRQKIDDEFIKGKSEFFELSRTLLTTRTVQAQKMYTDLLSRPFDLEQGGLFETDPERRAYCTDSADLYVYWRDYLKERVLRRVYDRLEDQAKPENQKDPDYVVKTLEQIEAEARTKELELHNEWFADMADFDQIDWMGVYLNSIAGYYDPHTEYFPPQRKEAFEIEMSGQFEGIGAQLSQEGDFIKVEKIISGSASWRQGELEEGDLILKVGQGSEEPVDVVGMRINKAIKLIRGKKGTEVQLTVKKLDGSKKVIPIVRDVVELEATFARSAVIDGARKVGYLRLPRFYVDFYENSNRNCADDIRKELIKLKAAGVESIVFDLRNNGGGSLDAVVDIVGLFIPTGPVVQVKAPGKAAKLLIDRDPAVVYDGPLVVMVNEFSASASEIFAAAIQDYNRGLVIGSKTTFGKGTVQNVVDLDRNRSIMPSNASEAPLGALKLTIQKYYRVNGGTTQLKGVLSDVVLPDAYMDIDYGEKEERHPLGYDQITPAQFSPSTQWQSQHPQAIKAIGIRVQQAPVFDSIRNHAQYLKSSRNMSAIPLSIKEYTQYEREREAERKQFKNLYKLREPFATLNPLPQDEIGLEASKKEEADKWRKALSTDLYLYWARELALAI